MVDRMQAQTGYGRLVRYGAVHLNLSSLAPSPARAPCPIASLHHARVPQGTEVVGDGFHLSQQAMPLAHCWIFGSPLAPGSSSLSNHQHKLAAILYRRPQGDAWHCPDAAMDDTPATTTALGSARWCTTRTAQRRFTSKMPLTSETPTPTSMGWKAGGAAVEADQTTMATASRLRSRALVDEHMSQRLDDESDWQSIVGGRSRCRVE
ncbi:hypothetical protein DFP72DRAFT_1079774 [Ephemerocybe angulata]|uniref:Uncharacterized protein n=1 Tax=Ephemerocybe angulata TaxID=980116 RepID=A0A8H6HD98_9AGAR|nr:hypothetical protein DFP72DRAFT_1079774 [Tulosesus angulatus]